MDLVFNGFLGDQSGHISFDNTSCFPSMNGTGTFNNGFCSRRKVCFGSSSGSSLKIYDYTKRQLVLQSALRIGNETLTDIFLFINELKVVGYILRDEDSGTSSLYFRKFEKSKKGVSQKNTTFSCMESKHLISSLKFNEEACCYFFFDSCIVYKLQPY